jgi:hypothetical protein
MGPAEPRERSRWRARVICITWLLGPALLGPRPLAQETDAETIAELRLEIETLREEYEARLAAMEERLAELEAAGGKAAAAPTTPAEAELERLREAAREAASEPVEPSTAPVSGAPTTSSTRNRLNPEISMNGNVLGIASDSDRDEFRLQEFELDIFSNLDPYSRTRWTIAVGEEGEFEIEEGYVDWPSLPGALGLTVGKFRQQFGVLNRWHLHALPQVQYPLVLTTFFGEEGLAQTGLSLRWLIPRPWASANELTLQVTDGASEAFGGESFQRLAVLGHLKNYWDLSPASYFEWGLSGIGGETEQGGTSRVLGTDLTFHWQPPARAKYREVTWRTEILESQRDDPFGVRQEAWGGYSYLEGLIARNLYAGARYDRTEDPLEPFVKVRGISPYVTWWQSEFVRLRGEFQYLEDDRLAGPERRFLLQVTWAAGPHKHETY